MMKLGIVISQFPELHETFIARELSALRAGGLNLRIYSMKKCRDRIVHPEAGRLLSDTVYISWDDPLTWVRAVSELLEHPVSAVLNLWWTVRFHAWPPFHAAKALVVWFQSMALARQMRKDRVRHVHAHWATMPASSAVMISRSLSVSFSFTAHAWDIFVRNPSLAEKVRLASKVITCTAYNRLHLRNLVPECAEKIALNYHGVSLEKFRAAHPAPESGPLVPKLLSVGRLVEQKGFEYLLKAYRTLHQKGIKFKAVIVGEGPLKAKLESQIKASGLSGVVALRSSAAQDKLRKLYQDAFMFVLPCVIESNGNRDGIPNVILEAMAMSLPVVSTRVSGIPEAVEHGQTGVLVKERDADALAKAIGQLLANPLRARQYGSEGGRRVAQMFDEKVHLKRLTSQMNDLVGSNPSRILFLIDKLVPAGTQTNLLEIVKGLDPKRFRAYVVALRKGGALAGAFRELNADPVIMGVKKIYGFSALLALFRLRHLIRKERIDIIQTHFLHADILGVLAARLAGRGCVVLTRRDEGFWHVPGQRRLSSVFNRFADRILVNSCAVKRAAMMHEKVSEQRIRLIYNGVDHDRFHRSQKVREALRNAWGLAGDECVVGMVANMRHDVKGHKYFIEAIPSILKEIPKARFVVIGDGPLETVFKELAERIGVSHSISFLGMRRDVARDLNAFDIVCVPSLSEGFSNTILEAMAAGIPVVASAAGGNPEAVSDGETGYLVAPRNSAELAGAVVRLLKDTSLYERMRERSRQRIIQGFTIGRMIHDYEHFYEELGTPKRKILYLIWSLALGGAEQVVLNLARHLDRSQFEPVICCLNEKGSCAPLAEECGVPVIALHKLPKFDPFVIPRLVRLIRREKIDLVHTHLFTANLWGRIAAWLANVPVVSTEHGMDHWRRRFHFWLDSVLLRISKRVICVSGGVKSFYQSKGVPLNGKAEVLHNGIDTMPFEKRYDVGHVKQDLNIEGKTKIIGTVGRLVPEKGHIHFIDAMGEVFKTRNDVVGLIVGDGKLRRPLEDHVRRCDLEGRVLFSGIRQDMPELYRAMDVFVLSSLTEGMPLTLLEAMASGVPVVATSVGGITECIRDGEDGLLVPPGDSAKLAESVLRILGDSRAGASLSERAKEKVRRSFGLAVAVGQHERLYKEVLAGG